MLIVKSIEIEGMHKVVKEHYDLDDKLVYLHGPNGVGKSTVLAAIQLALLGYIPGTNKNKESIFRHANNHTMAVTLRFGSSEIDVGDVTIRRVWTGTKKGITYTVDITPEGYTEDHIKEMLADIEIPLYNFNDFVGMTANKLKDWFISFMPDVEDELDWSTLLTDAVAETAYFDEAVVADMIRVIDPKLRGVEAVRAANETFKSLLSSKKVELERNAKTIQSLIYYEDSDDVVDVESLSAQKSFAMKSMMKAERVRDALSRERIFNEKLSEIRSKLSLTPTGDFFTYDTDPTVIMHNQSIQDVNKIISDLDKSAQPKRLRMRTIESEIAEKERIIEGDGVCPYTHDRCNSIVTLSATYKEEIAALMQEHSDLLSSVNDTVAKISEYQSAIVEVQSKLSEIRNIYTQLDALMRAKPVVEEHTPELLTTDYAAIIADIDSKFVKVEANKRYNALIHELTDTKYKLELEVEALKIWIKLTDANGLQSKLAAKPFEKLAEDIDEHLKQTFGKDVTAGFNISEKANSFSFGINRNGNYIPYDLLSSGEKCLYTLALMIVITKRNSAEAKFNVIMVDDLFDHLDDSNIEKLFESLYTESEGVQFIFAGVKESDFAKAVEANVEIGG